MARKRQAFVHVGLDDGSGDVVGTALDVHAHALLDLGVRRPTEPADADGTWAGLGRSAAPGRDTIVLSRPLLASARAERAHSLVGALDAFDVHVVVTAQAPDAWTLPGDPARDLTSVLDRWSGAVRSPDRLHVIVGGDDATTWKAFGRVVGFGTASLRVGTTTGPRQPDVVPAQRAEALRRLAVTWSDLLATSPYDVVGDLARLAPDLHPAASSDELVEALDHARHELDALRRHTADLELRLAKAEKKKRKLKKRLSAIG